MKYFLSEYRLQKYMLQKNIITVPQYVYNVLIRFVGEMAVGKRLRTRLFKFFRARVSEEEKDINKK